MSTKYLNPYTDFGFKKLFGEEGGKDLLTDFLNQLLPSYHQIVELSFKNPEKVPSTPRERKAIFDIYCQNSKGERFIVEMQKYSSQKKLRQRKKQKLDNKKLHFVLKIFAN